VRPPELREALLCPVSNGNRLVATLVRREGTRFSLILHLTDELAALATSPPALEHLSRELNLPVRVLPAGEGAFLAMKTTLADQEGRDYVLRRGG